jgi:hypothetical protein
MLFLRCNKTSKQLSLAILIIIIFVQCALAGTKETAQLDPSKEPLDFRGLQWGENISKIKLLFQFHQLKNENGHKIFSRNKENLTFGTANLELIYYGIIDEKLVYAVMFANGENGEKLIEEAIKCYGANFKKKTNESLFANVWAFQTVEVYTSFDRKDNSTMILYLHVPSKKAFGKLYGDWDTLIIN